MDSLFIDLARLSREQKAFSFATVIHTAGSTPQKAGARAIFLPDGRILGTLGGGCMEAEAAGGGEDTPDARRMGSRWGGGDRPPAAATGRRRPAGREGREEDSADATRAWPATRDPYSVTATRGHRPETKEPTSKAQPPP